MATKYVSTTGSNSNDGSISSPWLTISHAVAQLNTTDTELQIRGGVYTGSANTIDSQSFTVPNSITIRGFAGETAIIRPPNNVSGIRLTTGAPHHLTCEDFTVDMVNQTTAFGADGVYLSSGAHHNVFRRLDVKDGYHNGFHVSTANADSPFNEFLQCKSHGFGNPDDPTSGYGFYCFTSDCIYDGCEVYGNSGFGFHFRTDTGSPIDRCIIRNCKSYDNTKSGSGGGGAGIYIAAGSDSLVYNNEVWGNFAGIWVGVRAENTKVYNNTIHDNRNIGGIAAIFLQFYDSAPIVKNNILWANDDNTINDVGGGAVIANNHTTDPSFVNAAAHDYRLQSGSTAIDAGETLSEVTTDHLGVTRPQGSAYDRGAHEFVVSAGGTVSAKPRWLPVLGAS